MSIELTPKPGTPMKQGWNETREAFAARIEAAAIDVFNRHFEGREKWTHTGDSERARVRELVKCGFSRTSDVFGPQCVKLVDYWESQL